MLRQAGESCIEVLAVLRQHLRIVLFRQFAQLMHRIAPPVRENHVLHILRIERIKFRRAHAQHIRQVMRRTAQIRQPAVIHHAGEIRHQQRTAVFDERTQLLGETRLHQEEHRRNDQPVLAQISAGAHIAEIHRNALLPQCAIVHVHAVKVAHVALLPRLRVVNRPPVAPVKEDTRLRGGVWLAVQGLQRLQRLTDLRHIAENARIAAPVVVNDRAVELLRRATPLAPLEVADALAAMRHCLQGGQEVHSGAFEFVDGLPVDLRGRRFHEQERLIFQRTHDVVVHGKLRCFRHIIP